ncbi:MAG: hypothetical protein ACREEA_07565, partial [Stellaceae bacterium]
MYEPITHGANTGGSSNKGRFMRLWRGARSSLAFGEVTLNGMAAEAKLFFWPLAATFAGFRLTNREAPFASGEVAAPTGSVQIAGRHDPRNRFRLTGAEFEKRPATGLQRPPHHRHERAVGH